MKRRLRREEEDAIQNVKENLENYPTVSERSHNFSCFLKYRTLINI